MADNQIKSACGCGSGSGSTNCEAQSAYCTSVFSQLSETLAKMVEFGIKRFVTPFESSDWSDLGNVLKSMKSGYVVMLR